METKETYLPGERLSFGFVLVGKIKDYLPYFIVTFKELSQAGLGRDRAPVELAGVDLMDHDGTLVPIYTRANNLVQPPASAISWADLCASSIFGNGVMKSPQNGASKTARITLRFLTLTLLKADGCRHGVQLSARIAKRLRDRINALSYFNCGKGLDMDFKAFGEQAEKITTVVDSTRWGGVFPLLAQARSDP